MNQGLQSNKHDTDIALFSRLERVKQFGNFKLIKPFNGTLCIEVLNYFELFLIPNVFRIDSIYIYDDFTGKNYPINNE